jgi:hypothetical protein
MRGMAGASNKTERIVAPNHGGFQDICAVRKYQFSEWQVAKVLG